MKLSIVIPVLNSHEVVRRQLLHFAQMKLPRDTELVLVDDGSEPELWCDNGIGIDPQVWDERWVSANLQAQFLITGDTRPWTWALARNWGARKAQGEYLLMFDIDHIITADGIKFLREFDGLKVQFQREFGVLDENGVLTQDRGVLMEYGLPEGQGLRLGPLPNNFCMRRDLFWELGGYREDLVEKPYPQGEDRAFRSVWRSFDPDGSKVCTHRPRMFMFPNGYYLGDVDADPKGLFHGLSRKTGRNFRHQQQKRETP